MKKKFKILLFLAVSILFIFLALEVGLRIVFSPTYEMQKLFESDEYRWLRLRKKVIAHPLLGIIGTSRNRYRFWVRTNAQGLRAKREYFLSPSPETFRILCLGDSITFGWGVEEEFSFPRLLEEQLSQAWPGLGVEVINAGCPSYTTRQGLIWLDQELLRFQPHLLIIQFGHNDAQPAWTRPLGPLSFLPDTQVMPGRPGEWLAFEWTVGKRLSALLHRSAVLNLALVNYNYLKLVAGSTFINIWLTNQPPTTKRGEPAYESARVPLKDFQENLLLMAELCRKHGAALLLIDAYPTNFHYRKAIYAVGREAGVPVISQFNLVEKVRTDPQQLRAQPRFQPWLQKIEYEFGLPALRETPLLYVLVDAVHPNPIGNLLLVDELVKTIAPTHLPQPTEKIGH